MVGAALEQARLREELTSSQEETRVAREETRVAKGETVGGMADSMSLSVKTVSTYRTRVMEKLKLSTNSDLTYYALKNGLIQ